MKKQTDQKVDLPFEGLNIYRQLRALPDVQKIIFLLVYSVKKIKLFSCMNQSPAMLLVLRGVVICHPPFKAPSITRGQLACLLLEWRHCMSCRMSWQGFTISCPVNDNDDDGGDDD